jgi:hypothetical protein
VIHLTRSRDTNGTIRDYDAINVFQDKAPSTAWHPDKWDELLYFFPITFNVCE